MSMVWPRHGERESPWQGRAVETGSLLDAEILRDCWVSCLLLLINHERGKKQKAAEHYCFSFFFFFFSFLLLAFWVSCGGIGSEHDDRPARAAVPNSWTGNILGRQPCRASYAGLCSGIILYYVVLCCIGCIIHDGLSCTPSVCYMTVTGCR